MGQGVFELGALTLGRAMVKQDKGVTLLQRERQLKTQNLDRLNAEGPCSAVTRVTF